MRTRKPAVAGQFYPADRAGCLAEIRQAIGAGPVKADLPESIVAGIVPHAGWLFSGDLAALVFSAIKQTDPDVDTFIIFGAVHSYMAGVVAVYESGAWDSPVGTIDIDSDIAGSIAQLDCASAQADLHANEHSIEVQVPFIQHLFGSAKIVPVLVPPIEAAVQLGGQVASIISKAADKKIVCIASTDLTHYGPRYGFCPVGTGPEAIAWAKGVNDMKFINFALNMQPEQMLQTATEDHNACGAGAAAAAVAVAAGLGKAAGRLLAHTHSDEVMMEKFDRSSSESVGYAAIVY